MNGFLNALPWRLAALSSLVVGGLSAINGVDAWVALERCGLAFAAFWLMGMLAKWMLAASAAGRPQHSGTLGSREAGDRATERDSIG